MKRTIVKLLSLSLVLFMLMTTAPVVDTATAEGTYNLVVVPECGFNTLTWDLIPGATHYSIYRGPGSGQQYSTPLTDFPIAETTYKDTKSIKTGREYCYIVKGVSSDAVEFEQTNEVCVTPICYEEDECKLVLKYQQDNVKYWVNETSKGPMDTPPVNFNSRLFLVVRYVTEEITGTTIGWDGAEKKVTITTRDGYIIELWIGKPIAKVDGVSKQIDPMDDEVVPFIDSGRTLLPMRFVAENLGATGPNDIIWYGADKIVELRFDDPECDECEWILGEIKSIKEQNNMDKKGLTTGQHFEIEFETCDGTPKRFFAHEDIRDTNNKLVISEYKGCVELCVKNGVVMEWKAKGTADFCCDDESGEPNTSGWQGAGGSPYVGSAITQPIDINVSRTSDESISNPGCHLILDSSGYPHIIWRERLPDSEVFYVHWNGTNWECANGDDYAMIPSSANVSKSNGDSWYPSLVLDSSDNPHIAWSDDTSGNDEILYIHWNGTNWECANGDDYAMTPSSANMSKNSGNSWHPSLALDSSDNPYITWNDATTGNLEILYVHWNDSNWVSAIGYYYWLFPGTAIVSSNSGSSIFSSLALDSNDNPHITWQDGTTANPEVFYAHWSGTNWKCANGDDYDVTPASANVSNNSDWSRKPSFVLDSNENPHITWHDYTLENYEILYVRWSGNNWECANGDNYTITPASANVSNNSLNSENLSLVLDNSDNPHMIWQDRTTGNPEIFYIHYVP
jgi:Copper amine oxidase N-terminal domain